MASSQELNNALWASANVLRGHMSASQYMDYLLGLIFYKYLSDHELYRVVDLLEDRKPASFEEAQSIYENAEGTADWNELISELEETFGYAIKPAYTFTAFYNQINNHTFLTTNLKQGMRDMENGGIAVNGNKPFTGLFQRFDPNAKTLGETLAKRNATLADVMMKLEAINFMEYDADALGDAYEYLIGQFAAESGKKAGEFYTPQAVSALITRIVTAGKEQKRGFSLYDPCMGSGSLLLQARSFIAPSEKGTVQFYGQELNTATYDLARMNMILHAIKFENQHFRNGDTLSADWPTDEPTTFDAVCMNPPYSAHWTADAGFLTDPRFAPYEKLAPKTIADYAFLLHGYYHLKDTGTMGIVLPHGVLFRSGAEGVIRQHLLENGSIYAVIGLPAGIFFNTSIPTCVIILKKDRETRDVFFIDASKEFRKGKAHNYMDPEHIDKIVNAYMGHKDIEKFSHLADFEEIKKNEFNLNIPRYVDTFEEEAPVDLGAVFNELSAVNEEEAELSNKLNDAFAELGLSWRL